MSPTLADVYWGEPGLFNLKYASETYLSKAGTNVVLVDQAWVSPAHASTALPSQLRDFLQPPAH